VFVERPAADAYAPLRAPIIRSAVIFVMGLALSVLASLFLARRMVAPIRVQQEGAERIGAGRLDQPIELSTGDEIEALAGSFNRMTARLKESYEGLEQKVEARTRELADATRELTRSVEELRALGDVGQAVSRSLDIQSVLTSIVAHAVGLSQTDAGTIYEFDDAEKVFVPKASYGLTPEVIESLRQSRIRIGEAGIGQAAAARAAFQVPDIEQEPSYPLALLREAGYRAVLAVPLLGEHGVIGGLVVRRRAPGTFPQATVDLLQTFAT
jgi:adenylate cyclase